VARVLIVGCGGRGQALARALLAEGHAVRGTTRDPARAEAIAAAGAEPYVGDPDRIATLMEAIPGVTVVAWLLGSAQGERAAELHAGRLRMLCEKLVDTHVRGLLYEAAGTLPGDVLEGGRAIVADAAERWSIPVALVETDPADCPAWREDAVRGVRTLLARRSP
jgi:NADP-dependent 3-hydroxy acid dehydrogenase YdfG